MIRLRKGAEEFLTKLETNEALELTSSLEIVLEFVLHNPRVWISVFS